MKQRAKHPCTLPSSKSFSGVHIASRTSFVSRRYSPIPICLARPLRSLSRIIHLNFAFRCLLSHFWNYSFSQRRFYFNYKSKCELVVLPVPAYAPVPVLAVKTHESVFCHQMELFQNIIFLFQKIHPKLTV